MGVYTSQFLLRRIKCGWKKWRRLEGSICLNRKCERHGEELFTCPLKIKRKILSMTCTYSNGTSPIFLLLLILISLLCRLPPQVEYELLEDKGLGLPYSCQFPSTKNSSSHMVEAQSIFVELLKQTIMLLDFPKVPSVLQSSMQTDIQPEVEEFSLKSNEVRPIVSECLISLAPCLSNRRIALLTTSILRIQNTPR